MTNTHGTSTGKHYVLLYITEDIADALAKDVVGDGGFEGLLRRLRGCNVTYRESAYLELDAETLERLHRYAYDYGQGGWEERLRPILKELVKLMGWKFPQG
jgi:hypothetical protein